MVQTNHDQKHKTRKITKLRPESTNAIQTMPPQSHPAKPNKFYFYYGHRKPSQNRPTVYGGLFSNRQTLNPKTPKFNKPTNFDLQKWDPDSPKSLKTPATKDPSEQFFSLAQNLSPVARYIVDSFRKHTNWGPQVVADLNKLRRVTPKLVAEVLKVQTDPRLSFKFFHWAGKHKGYKCGFFWTSGFSFCF